MQRTFQTDAQGTLHHLGNLPYGRYRLEISKTGFATQSVSDRRAVRDAHLAHRHHGAGERRDAKVDVVAATPLAGTDLAIDQIAGPVQTATAADIENSGALDLADFMNRRLNGVYLNEMQANPFQPDVNFRGYTASPLLGTPEGISVYVDGVRQNQPFGDVVSWDLIPKNAISEITLVPGSDPLFGLNTLGGALSVQTKDGVSNPGLEGTLTYGSSGRKQVQASYGGGKATGFNWFLAGNWFPRIGMALRLAFGRPPGVCPARLAHGQDRPRAHHVLRLQHSDRQRTAGLSPARGQLFERLFHPRQHREPLPVFQFHRPAHLQQRADVFRQRLVPATSAPKGSTPISTPSRSVTIDLPAERAGTGDPHRRGLYRLPDQRRHRRQHAVSEMALHRRSARSTAIPTRRCDGVNIYSKEVQNDYGFSGQIDLDHVARESDATSSPPGRPSTAAASTIPRTRSTAISIPTTPSPAFRHGRTDRPAIIPVDSRVNLHGLTPNWSLYFTDTLTLAKTVNVTVSGRYNRLTVDNSDRINPDCRTRLARRRLCVSAIQSRRRDYLEPDLDRECLCEIHAGQPRADGH